MTQNIERVLERGQRLEELMDKTTDLEANVRALHFVLECVELNYHSRIAVLYYLCDDGNLVTNTVSLLYCHGFMLLVRPKTIVFGRTYVLAQMFFFLQREISEMRGPTGVKFCTMVSTGRYFRMPFQNFGGLTPKKFQGSKTCKIWPNFGRLRSSAANISETDEDIQNWIVIPSMAIRPAFSETGTVKFGPVTLEI